MLLDTKRWFVLEGFRGPNATEHMHLALQLCNPGGPSKHVMFSCNGLPDETDETMIATERSTRPPFAPHCRREVLTVPDEAFSPCDENFLTTDRFSPFEEINTLDSVTGSDSREIEFFFEVGLRKEGFAYDLDLTEFPGLKEFLRFEDATEGPLVGCTTLQDILQRLGVLVETGGLQQAAFEHLISHVHDLMERGFKLHAEPDQNPCHDMMGENTFVYRRIDPMPLPRLRLIRALVSLRELVTRGRASSRRVRVTHKKTVAALLDEAAMPLEVFRLVVEFL